MRSVDFKIEAGSVRTAEAAGSARDPLRGAASLVASLPLPAAILVPRGAGLRVLDRNDGFVALASSSIDIAALHDRRRSLGRAVADVLDAPLASAIDRFDWTDGDPVAGRHLAVMLARIDAVLGRPACLATLIDRTAEIATARSLSAELAHDSLTGLPNRAAFADAVDDVVAGAAGKAVLIVNLARFSRVNESLGVMAGDETIITVARRLISTLRAGDFVARVGGDEFGLLVSAENAREVAAAAERVHDVLVAPMRLSRSEVALECVVGCALSGGAVSGEDLVRHAQLALRRARASGRIEIHDACDGAGCAHRLDLETELRRAIGEGALSLAFQPIVDLATDRLAGFEALARWRHSVRGPIDPNEFIAIAEETGQIVPLGRWALDRALATLAAWDRAAPRSIPPSIAVNVSAIQLARDDVPAFVAAALARHGIAGARLTIELTESAIVQDPERTSHALRALKALDVRIAMDDFGTGYSNLVALHSLPIDVLKIDRSFVAAMLADRDKVAIVRAVLGLADALGKRTVAEGVETAETGRMLAALGCDRAQGFLYGAPMLADEAEAYLAARA